MTQPPQPPQHPRRPRSPNPMGPWREDAGPYWKQEWERQEVAVGWGKQQPRGAAPPQQYTGPVPQQHVQGGYYDPSGNWSPGPPQQYTGPVPQQYGQGGYHGQGQPYPQQQYPQQQYPQQQYAQPSYGQQQYGQHQYGHGAYGHGGYGNAAYTPKRTSSSIGMWPVIGLLFLAGIISANIDTPATGVLWIAALVLLGAKIVGALSWDGPKYGTPSHGINRYGKSVPLGDINR